jgi:hypothetical protein
MLFCQETLTKKLLGEAVLSRNPYKNPFTEETAQYYAD